MAKTENIQDVADTIQITLICIHLFIFTRTQWGSHFIIVTET